MPAAPKRPPPAPPPQPPQPPTPQSRTEEPQVYDEDYFSRRDRVTGDYWLHSAALKWFRDWAEKDGRTHFIFSNDAPVHVPVLIHYTGTDYSFSQNDVFLWYWLDMVGQLDAASRRLVVEGPDYRSRGIVQCRIQKTDIYDHKRHHALGLTDVAPQDTLKVWDFILTREDGSYVCLHPNYLNHRVECKYGTPPTDHEVPRTGPGGTSGPGIFRYFVRKHVDKTLKFQTCRRAPQSRNKARPAAPPQARNNPAATAAAATQKAATH